MLAAASLFLTACASTTQPAVTTIARTPPVHGEVVSIVDGDTIRMITGDDEITVRLAAINTPDEDECHHEEATARLNALVGDAAVSLEILGIDQFDRMLAHVFTDERHVNREIVSSGLALVSDLTENDPHGGALLDAEDDAFESGVGLWASDACDATGPLPDVAIDPEASVPDPPGPDDSNPSKEFVTIVNRGMETVDLGGWRLRDTSTRHRFTFQEGTSLGPGEDVVVGSDALGWDPGDSPVWNNDGDMALLLEPSGRVVSRWRY
jgi:micrococcal nuclease